MLMLVAKLSILKVVLAFPVFVAPTDKHCHQLHTPVQTILGLCNIKLPYWVENIV